MPFFAAIARLKSYANLEIQNVVKITFEKFSSLLRFRLLGRRNRDSKGQKICKVVDLRPFLNSATHLMSFCT